MPRLWRFGIVLTADGEGAADLVQAACVRAIGRADVQTDADAASDGDALALRLMTSMRVIAASEQRDASVRHRLALLDGLRRVRRPHGVRPAGDPEGGRFAPIRALPQWHRVAVLLVGVEGFDIDDAAQVLGVPVGVLTRRLAAARGAERAIRAPRVPRLIGPRRPVAGAGVSLRRRLAD